MIDTPTNSGQGAVIPSGITKDELVHSAVLAIEGIVVYVSNAEHV